MLLRINWSNDQVNKRCLPFLSNLITILVTGTYSYLHILVFSKRYICYRIYINKNVNISLWLTIPSYCFLRGQSYGRYSYQ